MKPESISDETIWISVSCKCKILVYKSHGKEGICVELQRYNKYTREQARTILAPDSKPYKRGAGSWGMLGIVPFENQSGLSDYAFFVTLGISISNYSFDEYISENGVLSWQSQPGQDFSNKQIKDFINHNSLPSKVHLFFRPNGNKKEHYSFVYLGELKYLTHDNSRTKPVHFLWKILDFDKERFQEVLPEVPLQTNGQDIGSSEEVVGNIGEIAASKKGVSTSEFLRNIDFMKQYENAVNLGDLGEDFVVALEKRRLQDAGRYDLAERVCRTQSFLGNTAPYDIQSFFENGDSLYIEVKTTSGPLDSPLFVSESEVQFSEDEPDSYQLVRVFNFDCEQKTGEIKVLEGPVNRSELQPKKYEFRIINF